MTLETARLNINGYFWAFNRRCVVLVADMFGGQVHYGFMTVDNGNPVNGWIPAEFVGGTELTK